MRGFYENYLKRIIKFCNSKSALLNCSLVINIIERNMRFIFLLFISPISLFAQDTEKLQSTLDSLEKEKTKASKQIENIDKQIKDINQKIFETVTKKNSADGVVIKTINSTDIFDKRNWTTKLGTIPPNFTLLGYDDKSLDSFKYYLVNYNGTSGIVFTSDVETIMQERTRLTKEEILLKNRKEQIESLQKKYGKVNGDRIYNESIWIGMTKEMIVESWGSPNDINKTVGSWGVHEQWIYNSTYLYIENGILTSWQD